MFAQCFRELRCCNYISKCLCVFFFQENLVESKHHKLVRSVRSGTVSHEMKPNAAVRDQLNVSFAIFFSFLRCLRLCVYGQTPEHDEFCTVLSILR